MKATLNAISLKSTLGITIVPLMESHATALASLVARNIEHLQTFLPAVTELAIADKAVAHIHAVSALAAKGELFEWHVFFGDVLCGNIRLKDVDQCDKKAKIGYFIGSEFQGRGIATSAVRAVLAHCFHALGINRVELRCATDNLPSMRVAERLGFTREGVLRQDECVNGAFVDTCVYGLLRQEFVAERRFDTKFEPEKITQISATYPADIVPCVPPPTSTS